MNVREIIPAFLRLEESDLLPEVPHWLSDFRQEHKQALLKHGLPSRKNEYWKYSNFSFLEKKNVSAAKKIEQQDLTDSLHQHRLRSGDAILLVLVNGYFMPQWSDLAKLPENVIVCGMNEALSHHADKIHTHLTASMNAEKYPFACLNAAKFVEGLFVMLPDACILKEPLHVLSLVMDDQAFIAHPHHMILLGKECQLTLAEEYFSRNDFSYMMNNVTTIHLDQQARCHHYKIQQEGQSAVHLASHFVHQKKYSYYSHVNFSLGAQFARDDVIVELGEHGAECHTSGFYHLRQENQYIDNHIDIHHAAPHSQSDMLYKGIVDNQSRLVFNGRLHVAKGAQKISAYQANHNLLLSRQAEVYSKPELEIYADDVKCKHGATTGQLDQKALFYLRSRGISYREAVNILLQGFAEEIIQRVSHEGIKMRVLEAL